LIAAAKLTPVSGWKSLCQSDILIFSSEIIKWSALAPAASSAQATKPREHPTIAAASATSALLAEERHG
jgi:hypothetical protein